MKKIIFIVLFLVVNSIYAQEIEKGDSEILFNASYYTIFGDSPTNGMGFGTLVYQYYLTNKLNLGIGTLFSYFGGEDKWDFTGLVTLKYGFSASAKNIPYINIEFYQRDFSPEKGNFFDYTFTNVGVGLKNFLNENVSLDTNIKYGFPLSNPDISGLIQVLSGISVIF